MFIYWFDLADELLDPLDPSNSPSILILLFASEAIGRAWTSIRLLFSVLFSLAGCGIAPDFYISHKFITTLDGWGMVLGIER